ncbi:GGDEF domain-containing protein [Roseiflexus sp. RS-1]|uniref:GGDEF domain-containing protein n=1 Tax=Roseiflexus sp. (strain RS-1) TaxID=357808 RepID=UPI0002D6CFBA|nr:GGDEF domain-containing protein [Roseiflexus sp. RS-1]
MKQIEQERRSFEQQRRRIYRVAGVLGMLAILYTQYIIYIGTEESPLYEIIYTINHIAFAGVCFAIVWTLGQQQIPLERVERFMLFFFIFQSLVFNSIVPALLRQHLDNLFLDTIGDDIWFLLIVCVLAVHLYDLRRGALIAGIVYSLSFAIVVVQIVSWNMPGIDGEDSEHVLRAYLMGGALLVFLVVLAMYRSHIERLHTEYEVMANLAYTDTLTSLPNRRRLYEDVYRLIALAERYGQEFCVCLFDLDHFKRLNDTHGHLVGDQVLQEVAQVARLHLRAADLFGRWGGEEFVVLLPQTRLNDAQTALERVRLALHTIALPNVHAITASFGIAAYLPGDTSESLLHRADQALYLAKATGRNRIVLDSDPVEAWGV